MRMVPGLAGSGDVVVGDRTGWGDAGLRAEGPTRCAVDEGMVDEAARLAAGAIVGRAAGGGCVTPPAGAGFTVPFACGATG